MVWMILNHGSSRVLAAEETTCCSCVLFDDRSCKVQKSDCVRRSIDVTVGLYSHYYFFYNILLLYNNIMTDGGVRYIYQGNLDLTIPTLFRDESIGRLKKSNRIKKKKSWLWPPKVKKPVRHRRSPYTHSVYANEIKYNITCKNYIMSHVCDV